MTAIWAYLWHIERLPPVDVFSAVLIEAWVVSKIPIVCACFVDTWMISISRICVISATTSDLNCEPLSDKIKVGRYACLVMTSTMQRPIVFAVTFCVVYANRYRENTSIIVTMFWHPAEFGRFGSMSISSMSYGPNTCSVLLIIFGRIWLKLILLYLMQFYISLPVVWFFLLIPGSSILICILGSSLWFQGVFPSVPWIAVSSSVIRCSRMSIWWCVICRHSP